MNELYYYLPGILLIGAITSYEDYKYGKIKNRWITLGVGYTFLVTIFLIMTSLFQQQAVSGAYFLEFFVNSFIMLAIGILLWKTRLWSAADAKLCFLFSLMVPLSVYTYGYVHWFPANTLLINMFLPIGIFFCLFALIKTDAKKKKEVLKQILVPKNLFVMLLAVFMFGWVINLTLGKSFLATNVIIMLFLLFLVVKLLEKSFRISFFYMLIFGSLLRLILDASVFTRDALGSLSLQFSVIVLMNIALGLGNYVFGKEVNLTELKEGMILGEVIVREDDSKYAKINLNNVSFWNYLDAASKDIILRGRLSADDLAKLKSIISKDADAFGFKSVCVNQSMPFAPYLFLGVLLTLLLKADLVSWIGLFV